MTKPKLDRPQALHPWHAMAWVDVLKSLGVSESGIGRDEAAKRLTTFGSNRLPEAKPTTIWVVVFRQFRSPLIYILLVAAVFSLAIGEINDALFILGVLVLNAAIGSSQEWKAQESANALRGILNVVAVVRRDDSIEEVEAESLVPGDLVYLESGNRVPADLRLRDSHGLEIDESLLTGESLPVTKVPEWSGTDNALPSDQLNIAFAGSMVSRGRGTGVVVATGSATGVGRLALEMTPTHSGKPPLLLRMQRFANIIAWTTILASGVIGLVSLLSGHRV